MHRFIRRSFLQKKSIGRPIMNRYSPFDLLMRMSSGSSVFDPSDSYSLKSITVDNIKPSFRPWFIKGVEQCAFKELTFGEQDEVFNRLLMVHAFDTFLRSEKNTFDCEVLLTALCSLIDYSFENGAKSFVVGLSQLSQLSTLAYKMESTAKKLFMEVLDNEDDRIDLSEDEHYLLFIEKVLSEFVEPSSCKPFEISLFGPPSPASAVYALMLGRAKALQNKKKSGGSDKVWPVFCYPFADICSEDNFNNIVKILKEPQFSAGGTIHLITNREQDGFEEKRKSEVSSSKFIKELAAIVKAPVVHVKAKELDSVVCVMKMVSDFRANHKRDIFVNLKGSSMGHPSSHKNLAFVSLVKKMFKEGEDSFVSTFCQDAIALQVLSRMEYEDRREGYMQDLMDYTDFESFTKQKNLKKRIKEPFAKVDSGSMRQMISSLDHHLSNPDASVRDGIENPFSVNRAQKEISPAYKLNWKMCLSLAYASLLREGRNIHISRLAPGPASPTVDPRVLVPASSCSGDVRVMISDVAPFAMAGFHIGYSSANDGALSVWEVPQGMEPSVLFDIAKKYIGVLKFDDEMTTNAIFLVPSHLNVPSSEATRAQVNCQMSQLLKECEDCKTRTSCKQQPYDCNAVVASVSTPANLFHLIRQQAQSPVPKPLIAYIPVDVCDASIADELTGDTCFQPYIGDSTHFGIVTKNIILCTGRMQHELKKERACRNMNRKIAIAHIDQLCPFPCKELIEDMDRFPEARIWWAQEEENPKDGCWSYIESRLHGLFGDERDLIFAGHSDGSSRVQHAPTLADRVKSIFDAITDP